MNNVKVAIVGAGPGGISAAVTAAENGATVNLIDENPGLGGQIWRHKMGRIPGKQARRWIERLSSLNINFLPSTTVVGKEGDKIICVSHEKKTFAVDADKLILANGAKELFLPFPNWHLPKVIGCGGAQALVKSGLNVRGKTFVIAGTGPLMLAVAYFLKRNGAQVLGIFEQAKATRLTQFAARLLVSDPTKLWQGIVYKSALLKTPVKTGWWVKKAEGSQRLERVIVTNGKKQQIIQCDYLAYGYGLVPNTELASILGCAMSDGFIDVNEQQESQVDDVYAVGELTGIGGVDKALLEGTIAGHAVCGKDVTQARRLKSKMDKFTLSLSAAYKLRSEVKELADDSTVFCRCEDVLYSSVCGIADQRSAKLYTRCGMGSCQGRVCSAMGRELFGWDLNKVSAPLIPMEIDKLIV